jgi:recombination protein RecT
MTETVSNAVAKRETGALAVMDAHRRELLAVLPTHVRSASWYAGAQAALRKDKDLFAAANGNPGSLMNALHHAARLGLEPGTEQFYLTWRRVKGAPQVQGIVGYQGEIELIYRAGAVSSVIVEVVRTNDKFDYVPGRDDRPVHEVDWFGARGDVIGAYAYAIMRDGATSKVVVIGEERIKRAIAASPTANSSHSPWKTDYAAMVLKTAAHDLQKWVPTSSEYAREQLRAVRDVQAEHVPTDPTPVPQPTDILDGELVEDAPAGELPLRDDDPDLTAHEDARSGGGSDG